MGTWKQRRSRQPMTIKGLQLTLTDAKKELEKVILDGDYDPETIQLKIQCINALSGIASRYRQIVETSELVDRIERIEGISESK